ncbi:hypothetical protein [Nostoc sp.]
MNSDRTSTNQSSKRDRTSTNQTRSLSQTNQANAIAHFPYSDKPSKISRATLDQYSS